METSVESISLHPDERDLATLISTDVPIAQPKHVLECGYIKDVCFSPVNNDIIAICGNAEFTVWDVKSNSTLFREETHRKTTKVNFSFDGIYASASGRKIFVFDMKDFCLKWKDEADIFCDVIWHPGRRRFYFFNDASIYMSELPLKPTVLYTEENVDDRVYKLAISKNGRFLVSATSYCNVRIFDTETNEIIYRIQQKNKRFKAIYKICASETFFILEYYSSLEVFSLKNGKLVAVFSSLDNYLLNRIYGIEFLEKDRTFAVTSYEGWINIFDLATLTMKNYTFDTEIFGPFISFDHFKMFFNKGKDNLIRIFDPKTKKIRGRYQHIDVPGHKLMIAPDHKRFISYNCDGRVNVFDIE